MWFKQKKIFFVIILFVLVGFGSISEVHAEASEGSIDVLFNDVASVEVFKEKLLSIDSDVEFYEIPEIYLLRINQPSPKIEQEIYKNKNVEMSGKLTEILIEDKRLIDQKIPLRNISMSRSLTLQNTIDDFDLLDNLAWYKYTMIKNQQSFEFSEGQGVRIGLIDSGVDIYHPLISPVLDLSNAKSYIEGDNSIRDTNGHGTMVAGVIAQISPKAVITPYRVIGDATGDSYFTIQAMIQAVQDEQDILNMSLGTYKYSNDENEQITIEAYERAVQYALQNNVMIVSSSGNKGLDLDLKFQEEGIRHLPGSIPGVFSVSALTRENALASYSNIGSNIQFAAPGGDYVIEDGYLDVTKLIYTAYPTDMDNMLGSIGVPQGYMFSTGTSLSAPAVSAAIADYYAYYQKMTGERPTIEGIKNDLSSTALDLGVAGKDTSYGYGLPQVSDAYGLIPTYTFSVAQ
ncbi:S8 family peptidase [Paenibacillus sp. IHBB 10380]|uniref:S8 family peptidase n=1 Tax=Paenibacillus sp. IHBB 10380 TaxID=1566358 RepID=UPI00069709C6|nr:S8 family serine peptidase [Paenibacillus sp. IHBB 10380]